MAPKSHGERSCSPPTAVGKRAMDRSGKEGWLPSDGLEEKRGAVGEGGPLQGVMGNTTEV